MFTVSREDLNNDKATTMDGSLTASPHTPQHTAGNGSSVSDLRPTSANPDQASPIDIAALTSQAAATGEVIVRGCPQQALVALKHLTADANRLPHASASGLVDNGSVCSRDYARTDTSLASIRGAKEPTPPKKRRSVSSYPGMQASADARTNMMVSMDPPSGDRGVSANGRQIGIITRS